MAENEFAAVVVCDAGPLIHLDELDCLDLLNQFTRIVLPEAVYQEVKRHRPSAFRRRTIRVSRVSDIPRASPMIRFLVNTLALGTGEQEALRLMQRFPDATFLTDDGKARLAARGMNVSVHGTLGVILRAFDQGLKTKRQVLHILKSIPQKSTLFIKPSYLTDLIQRIEGLNV